LFLPLLVPSPSALYSLSLHDALPISFLVPATALAFWPVKRYARELRTASLVLLIVLYGMSLAERSPSGQVGRGFVLLLLIAAWRSEEHTSELQSRFDIVCRLLLEKKK